MSRCNLFRTLSYSYFLCTQFIFLKGFFGTIGNCVRDPCAAKPCKQPDSTCIPIQPGNILTIGSCTCTANTEPGYACVCKSPIPYVAATC